MVTSAVTNQQATFLAGQTSSAAKASSSGTMAGNFQTFLQLLTTQLQNQSPLDPLDTNQFTAQLVQFSQVEQLLKSNQQLETLVSMQKTIQSAQAVNYAGATVAVDGTTAELGPDGATWYFSSAKPATATVNVTNARGESVYTGKFTVGSGQQAFTWDGMGTDGSKQPAGQYRISVTGTDASGQSVAISTEVQGVVESVDVTATPPVLSINGMTFAADRIKRIIATNRPS